MNVWLAADESDPDSTPGHIRHYYLDLGDCFGSDWDFEMLSKRLGHAYYLDFGYVAEDFVTLGLIELGLKPHLMSEEVLVAMLEKVRRHAERIDRSRILPRVRWNAEVRAACAAG